MPWVEETFGERAAIGKLLTLSILIALLLSSINYMAGQGSSGSEARGSISEPARNDEGPTRGPSNITIASPDGQTTVRFWYGGTYISYDMWMGTTLLLKGSRLGLKLEGDDVLPSGPVELRGAVMDTVRGEYSLDLGESPTFKEEYRFAEIILKETQGKGRTLKLTFRAYDEGVALRYSVPAQNGIEKTVIVGEATTFSFTRDMLCFAEYGSEDEYMRVPISKVRSQCEVPLTIEMGDGRYASIGEAALLDYSRMLLKNSGNQTLSLQVQLSSRVVRQNTFETPWRVVLIGNGPGDLLENSNILYSLCPPNKIGKTSWIVPGKAFRDCSLTTNGSKAVIDFCFENGLQYVHLDAGWYGKEYDPKSDATTVSVPDLDIPEIVRYGEEKGIGLVLYVSNRSLRRQVDAILPLYHDWGIKGIKFGFIDGRSQGGINFLHSAVQKAAEHELFVIIHDNYRPSGLTRTFPNIVSVEGVRGNENHPTSYHNTLLPYTRSICGPMDYTPRAVPYKNRTTSCHQMALPILYFSPITYLYWYQDPLKIGTSGAFEAWSFLPTIWDEAVYPNDMPGRFASAMKRKGDVWFIGAINGPLTTRAVLDLSLMGEKKVFAATIYSDDNGTIEIRRYLVDSGTVIDESLLPNGGLCAIVRPATDLDIETIGWYPSWSRTTAEVTVEEDREMVLLLYTSGQVDRTITYDTWADSDFISFDPVSGVVTGTPENGDVGLHHLSILVRYDGEPVSSIHVIVNVLNTNDPPEITELPRYLDLVPGREVVVEPAAVDIDPTGDELIWSLLHAPGFLSIDPVNGIIHGVPGAEDVGVHLFEVCVDDGLGGRCVRQVVAYINESSDDINIRTLNSIVFLYEDVQFELDLIKELESLYNSTVDIVYESVPDFVSIDAETGILRGTPGQSDTGTYEVVLRSKFGEGIEELVQFRIVVMESNDPPSFSNSSIFIMTAVGESLEIRFAVQDEDDPQEDLKWSLSPEGSFIQLDKEAGTLKGAAETGDEGVHRLVLTVWDPEGGKASLDLTILVVPKSSYHNLVREHETPLASTGQDPGSSLWDNKSMIILWNSSGMALAVPMNEEVRKFLDDREEGEDQGGTPEDLTGKRGETDTIGTVLPVLLISFSLIVIIIPVVNHSRRGRKRKRG